MKEPLVCLDIVAKIFEEYPEFLERMEHAGLHCFFDAILLWYRNLFAEDWRGLARTPKAFDRKIDKHLAQIKKLMKTFFGIDAHRPNRNAARDLKIWRLREQHPTWSLTRIGQEVRLKKNAVASALERYQAKLQTREAAARMFLELMMAVMDERERAAALAPETKQLPGPVVVH